MKDTNTVQGRGMLLLMLSSAVASSIFGQSSTAAALLFPKPALLPPAPAKALFKAVAARQLVLRKRRLIRRRQGAFQQRALLTGALLAAPPLALGGAVAVAALSNVAPLEIYTPPAGALRGQSILITGGTAGLGLETAKRLAVGRPANLVITARSDDKGRAAVDEIYRYLSDAADDEGESRDVNVSYRVLDLDDVRGIEDAVAAWSEDGTFPSKLDCLINNAGVMNLPRLELTDDGVERQMASNHLGHFVLTQLLAPRLTQTAKVISVSSSAHQLANKGLDFDYCWEGGDRYDGWRSYGQSKLANILFSRELQRRSDAAGREWDVACLHPGAVSTDLWRQVVSAENYERVQDLARTVGDGLPDSVKEGLGGLARKSGDLGVFKTAEQGATTSVWLAAGAYGAGARTDARYYDNCEPQVLGDFAQDDVAAARLWRESEERAGIRFDVVEVAAMTVADDAAANEKEEAEEAEEAKEVTKAETEEAEETEKVEEVEDVQEAQEAQEDVNNEKSEDAEGDNESASDGETREE